MLWLEFEVDAVDRKAIADFLISAAETIREFPNESGVLVNANGEKVGGWTISPIEPGT